MLYRNNNYDFIRLMGSLLVLFGHAYALNKISSPLKQISQGQVYEGDLGVYIFFVISGYLITKSFMSKNNVSEFIKARFLRIVPGVAVVTVLTVFVLGPIVTTVSIDDYFTSSQTRAYLVNILPISVKYHLPGVFLQNPHGPNGSLWTLPLEIKCYAFVLLFGVLRVFRFRIVILAIYLIVLSCYLNIIPYTLKSSFSYYFSFITGCMFYLYREKISYKWQMAVVSVLGLILLTINMKFFVGFVTFGAYLILYLANAQWLKLYQLTKIDISYGIYIYAFPIQQLLIQIFGGSMNPILNFAIALPFTLVCATLSWYLVESPSLRLKIQVIGEI